MATSGRKPVLDLDELVERPIIKINGQTYEILNPDELNVLDFARLGRRWKVVAHVFAGGPVTDEDVVAGAEALGETTRLILKAPEEVHAQLTDGQRLKICRCFVDLCGALPATAESEQPATSQPETVETK